MPEGTGPVETVENTAVDDAALGAGLDALDTPSTSDGRSRTRKILGQVLLSWHNVAMFQGLTAQMREAIAEGRFHAFRKAFAARQQNGDA